MPSIANIFRRRLRRFAFGVDPKRLWARYAVGLGLIMALILTSHLAAQYSISVAENDAAVINDSGRQRMLSQRTMFYAQRVVRDGRRDQEALAALDAAVDRLEATHNDLVSRTDLTPSLRDVYFGRDGGAALDPLLRRFVVDARIVSEGAGAEAAFARMEAVGPDVLLQRLDAAVQVLEQEAVNHGRLISLVQAASLVAAIVILFIEALVIFLPAHLSARRALWKLERQAERLKRARTAVETRSLELQALRAQAEHEARHDALTGLANRRHLEHEMERRTANAAESGPGLAVLHIDLDRFKEINDTLGHAAGDFILRHVADTLRGSTRTTDFVARIGGDEFVVLTESTGDRRPLEALATRIIAQLSEPISYQGEFCCFGASIGVDIGVATGDWGIYPQRMLANADIALYRAKEQGRGRFAFFSEQLRQEAALARELGDEILLGLARGEFEPVYQPQVFAESGALCGFEALARWRHPQRGVLAPGAFLPVAERLGVTKTIDHLILCKALDDLEAWDRMGFEVPRISVNVSAQRLADPELPALLSELKIPKGRMSFEILESAFAERVGNTTRHSLDQLQEMGVELEIDDFGTGHASLLGLLSLSPTRLKIAREFVSPLEDSDTHVTLIRSMMEIARSLEVEVTAEGVETEGQAQLLRELGCDRLQGYLFSKPIDAAAVVAGLAGGTRWSPAGTDASAGGGEAAAV